MAYAGVDYNLSSPYVHSRVDSNTFTLGSRLYPPVRGLGFGLWKCLQEPNIYVLYTLYSIHNTIYTLALHMDT